MRFLHRVRRGRDVRVNDVSLKGKKVVVVGGTSGLGLATAQAAAGEGAQVVIAGSRKERLDRAMATLPVGASGSVLDVTQERHVGKFFEQVGAFDHLVYTAGDKLHVEDIESMSMAHAQRLFAVRYWGAFASIKYGARNIRVGGSIVLTSGGVSQRPWKGASVSASMCGAVESLMRAMAIELAPIRVNLVQPGLVKTDLWDAMTPEARQAMYDRRAELLPVGHVGEAADVAEAYLYLMRERFSTGATLVVDGGAALTQPKR